MAFTKGLAQVYFVTSDICCGAVGQDINSEISDTKQLSDFRICVRSVMCESAGLASLMCESAGLASRLFTLENQTIAMSRNFGHRTSNDATRRLASPRLASPHRHKDWGVILFHAVNWLAAYSRIWGSALPVHATEFLIFLRTQPHEIIY